MRSIPAVAGQTTAALDLGALRLQGTALPAALAAELRTNHAGEVGAVCIYQGILRVSRDPALRSFAQRHRVTEAKHLHLIAAWLPASHHSRLLPLWRVAGWITGALPALWGPRAVYATIEAVEAFVQQHYETQIHNLASQPAWDALRTTLLACQADEIAHREEATKSRGTTPPGLLLRLWCALVGMGSRNAVAVCRFI